jgi:hypothetical protein
VTDPTVFERVVAEAICNHQARLLGWTFCDACLAKARAVLHAFATSDKVRAELALILVDKCYVSAWALDAILAIIDPEAA